MLRSLCSIRVNFQVIENSLGAIAMSKDCRIELPYGKSDQFNAKLVKNLLKQLDSDPKYNEVCSTVRKTLTTVQEISLIHRPDENMLQTSNEVISSAHVSTIQRNARSVYAFAKAETA